MQTNIKLPTAIMGGKIVCPHEVIEANLLIDQAGRIAHIGSDIPWDSGTSVVDASDKYLLPGFIDIHTHGATGFDFSLGLYDAKTESFDRSGQAFQQGIEQALRFYAHQGVSRVFPTSLAASVDELEFAFQQLDTYASHPDSPFRQMIAGINLEGTFLKLPEYAGAQNPEYFYPASTDTFDRLNAASGGRIAIANVPPEHGEIRPGVDSAHEEEKRGGRRRSYRCGS